MKYTELVGNVIFQRLACGVAQYLAEVYVNEAALKTLKTDADLASFNDTFTFTSDRLCSLAMLIDWDPPCSTVHELAALTGEGG